VAARGVGRAVRLPVGAAFHSPLMRPVATELECFTAALLWRDALVPVVANADASMVRRGEHIRRSLVAQIAAPVRCVECVTALLESGCRHFLELGPGRVLSGLVRQICPEADVATADSRAAIEAFATARPHLLAA
jgi:[acyl-carrier-protein] S-malonyltransferase